jgi:hypothetical protein
MLASIGIFRGRVSVSRRPTFDAGKGVVGLFA